MAMAGTFRTLRDEWAQRARTLMLDARPAVTLIAWWSAA
jgi:hypothetical protein